MKQLHGTKSDYKNFTNVDIVNDLLNARGVYLIFVLKGGGGV